MSQNSETISYVPVTTVEKNHLVIRCPIPPTLSPSKTGKTLMVASSVGFLPTTAVVNGKPVTISLNAFIPI